MLGVMPRVARVVVPGVPYHVTQRGNNRQDVFFVDDDRRTYLELLGEAAPRFGLEVLGYCLMRNHVHLVVVPAESGSLAAAIGRTHWWYTRYVNRLHGRTGHLWQARFFSAPLDESHLWSALCYVERNPVRARLVRRAWNYPWSSAAAHAGPWVENPLLNRARWRELSRGLRWREVLVEPQDEDLVEQLRAHTRTGRPLGSDRFISKLETLLHRRLRANPVGRPRKPRASPKKRKTTTTPQRLTKQTHQHVASPALRAAKRPRNR